MDAAADDEVASIFAHFPDPLRTWQRLSGELRLKGMLLIAGRGGGWFAAPVAWEGARSATAHGTLPEALPLDVFLLLPALCIDDRSGVVAEGQIRPDRKVCCLVDGVIEIEVLRAGVTVNPEVLRRGCLHLSVCTVISFLGRTKGEGWHFDTSVVTATLEVPRKLGDSAMLSRDDSLHDFAHPTVQTILKGGAIALQHL